ncbi:class I SAM-dependent methyltransferase [Defluviitalea saccharophila]|uniref:Class I SAM-dependent methyltransferase n=1 Tax=Defluviitalea saccharophila TaxID=879970 RepID=A0ABZ2Y5P5_9FIRM
MGFYETLSTYYDKVFPLSDPCKTFIEKNLLQEKGKILDVGCSTGELDIFLGEKGYEVLGIDLDQKMIQIASEKIAGRELPVEFKVMNMEHLEANFSESQFDGVICIGNTLVHLSGIPQIKGVLKQMVSLLKPGGVLILQIINYDRIITQNVTELPPIENEDVSFIREYDYHEAENKVAFKTTLKVNKTNETFENEISLFPLRYEILKTMLTDLGLKNINWYGSFKGEPYDWNSYATVVTAQK